MQSPAKPVPIKPIPQKPAAPATLQPAAVRAEFCPKCVVSAKAFQCKECNQSYDTARELDLHMTYIHRSKEE